MDDLLAPDQLTKLTIPQLKAICKEKHVVGYSKLAKPGIIQKLLDHLKSGKAGGGVTTGKDASATPIIVSNTSLPPGHSSSVVSAAAPGAPPSADQDSTRPRENLDTTANSPPDLADPRENTITSKQISTPGIVSIIGTDAPSTAPKPPGQVKKPRKPKETNQNPKKKKENVIQSEPPTVSMTATKDPTASAISQAHPLSVSSVRPSAAAPAKSTVPVKRAADDINIDDAPAAKKPKNAGPSRKPEPSHESTHKTSMSKFDESTLPPAAKKAKLTAPSEKPKPPASKPALPSATSKANINAKVPPAKNSKPLARLIHHEGLTNNTDHSSTSDRLSTNMPKRPTNPKQPESSGTISTTATLAANLTVPSGMLLATKDSQSKKPTVASIVPVSNRKRFTPLVIKKPSVTPTATFPAVAAVPKRKLLVTKTTSSLSTSSAQEITTGLQLDIHHLDFPVLPDLSLSSITLPPSLSQRKRVHCFAVFLSQVPDEDLRQCILVSRMFRYAGTRLLFQPT